MKLVGSKKAVRSPEFHRKQELRRRIKISGVIFLAILLVVGPILILRNKNLLISSISVTGNDVTQASDIQNVVKENLQGKFLGLIPKSSIVFYPKSQIEKALATSMPRLSAVALTLTGADSVQVIVSERKPFALYCTDKCYFMDETGYIYSEAPSFSDGVYITYTSDPKLDSPITNYFLPQDTLASVTKFLNNLANLGLKTEKVTKTDDEYSALLTNGSTEVRWRADQDLNKLYTDLLSFFGQSNLKPSDIARLSYLDLRFDNKVYYKFAGE